jgi:hypothetical protein
MFFMKKLIMFVILAVAAYASPAQSCDPTCCKKTCEPDHAKKETASISTLRSDLQTVIIKMGKSSLDFDKQVTDLTVKNCVCNEEGLRYLSTVASSIRHEFVAKIAPAKLVASLKEGGHASQPQAQTLASLNKEVQLLAAQADLL